MKDQDSILNKRLPQSIGFLILAISLTTIGWLSRNAILFGSKAAAANVPKDVKVSNISDSSFTVSYVTDDQEIGTVSFGKDEKFGELALDVRDQTAKTPAPHRIHYITVSQLSPSTLYFFSITSGDTNFLNDKTPYEVNTTAKMPDTASTQAPATGHVALEDGTIPLETLIYIDSDESQLLSSLIQPDGSYSVPLSTILKKDLSGYLSLDSTSKLKMTITNGDFTSDVSFLAGQSDPIPAIILSKDYDFAISNSPLSPSNESGSTVVTGFPHISEAPPLAPRIDTPQSEEKFTDQQPKFSGKALPNTDVEILIQSTQEVKTTVQSDAGGNWTYRPDTALDPGTHTITIKSVDATGILQTLTQSFTVFAAGSQFTDPTGPVTITPTLQPTVGPTSELTQAPTNSPAPTVEVPTPTTPVQLSQAPAITTAPIPNSGSSSSLMVVAIGVLASVGIGGILFFLL